jgi:polyribonucleotide 5'-hydroxyl-kinase
VSKPSKVGDALFDANQTTAENLTVNIILVIGHEKLTVDMQKLYGIDNEDMLILKVPKSGGVRDFHNP